MTYNEAMQVIVDSLMTQYVRKGQGRTVLVLHGWGDSANGFQTLIDALSRQYDVIAVDLPGFGGSQAPPAAWGLTDYAQFVHHFLQKIHIDGLWAIIGHSNGGAIALRGLGQDVLQTDHLVLIASAGVRNVYKGRNKALRLVTKAGKLVTTPLPAVVKKKLRRSLYKTVGSDMLVAEHLQETFKRIVTDDVRGDAKRILIPTLLLYGEKDEATPLWYGEQYHELIAGSTLEVIGGAEHFVHLEKPQLVQKAIEEFLR